MGRRLGALVVVLGVLVAGAPACSSSDSAGGSTTVTVPALWAGVGRDGKVQSGIERAKVVVGASKGAAFSVDLTDIDARNAGPQWRAATSSAAAVGVLASAVDPASVHLGYTITGPIDGPSAGAILTIGTLAAIRGDRLAPDVTMTGTISPDSTIGRVGEIAAKLRAAAKAGFRIVLLPTDNLTDEGADSTTDMRAYGASLGLDVRGVDVLAQAYEVFTGVSLAGSADATAPWRTAAPTTAAARVTTDALLQRLATESSSKSIPAADATTVRNDLDRATAALAAGDLAKAYGLGVDGYTVLSRAVATERMRALITSIGAAGARDAMRTEISTLRARAATTLLSGSAIADADAVVQLGAPYALGWTTYADAVLAGIETWSTNADVTAEGLAAAAAAVGEQRASIEVFQPDALTVLRSAPNPDVTTVRPAVEFLSDYTDFMVEAGRANATYYETVVRRGRSTSSSTDIPDFATLTLDALTDAAAGIPSGVQSIDDEIRQSSLAATYFIVGTGLVSNTGATGIAGSGIGRDAVSTIDIPGLVASVLEAARIASGYASALGARGIDPSATVWSADWGVATAASLDGTGRDAMGEVIAQNELWYDVIAMASTWAATVPR